MIGFDSCAEHSLHFPKKVVNVTQLLIEHGFTIYKTFGFYIFPSQFLTFFATSSYSLGENIVDIQFTFQQTSSMLTIGIQLYNSIL